MSSSYQVNQQANNATPKQESITGVVERLTCELRIANCTD